MHLGCYQEDRKPEIDPTLETDPEVSGANYYLMAAEPGGLRRDF